MQAGNTVCETFCGDWPYPNSIMVFLDDPHHWKSEYFHSTDNRIGDMFSESLMNKILKMKIGNR